MTKKLLKWVHIKYDVTPPVLECARCQHTREFHLPASIDDVAKQSEAFCESHKKCKEGEVESKCQKNRKQCQAKN